MKNQNVETIKIIGEWFSDAKGSYVFTLENNDRILIKTNGNGLVETESLTSEKGLIYKPIINENNKNKIEYKAFCFIQ